MAWAGYKWLDGGNWWSQEATSSAAQDGQSSDVSGLVEIVGTLQSGNASQCVIGDGGDVNDGVVATGAGSQSTSASGTQEITGAVSVAQAQSATSAGFEEIIGVAVAGNASPSVVSAGVVEILGAASTQQSQTAFTVVVNEIVASGASGSAGQSASAAGSQEISGTASVAQSQTGSASGDQEITGVAVAGNASQSISIAADLEFRGFIQTGNTQSVLAAGELSVLGSVTASQSQTLAGQAEVAILAQATSAQTQHIVGSGVQEILGVVSTSQAQTVAGVVTLEISGIGSSSQTPYIYAVGEEEILGGGSTVTSQSVVAEGFESIDGAYLSGENPWQSVSASGYLEISGRIESDQMSDAQTTESAGELVIAGWVRTSQTQDTDSFAYTEEYERNLALYRLLEYPHSPVFDKSSIPDVAFRLSMEPGLTWRVERGILFLAAGRFNRAYPLHLHTLTSLSELLEADGVQVFAINDEIGHRSALTLINGTASENQSNGNRLLSHSSLLWALMAAYGAEIDYAAYQVIQALRQMVMTQAEGEWLDVWANLYGFPRLPGEGDPALQVRIPEEAFALRVNKYAIEHRIERATGKDVEIFEPWTLMFTLDHSTLSGPDRFADDVYYNYHVIQPIAHSPMSFDDVLPVVHRNRAAGVVVYDPQVLLPPTHLVVDDLAIAGTSITTTHAGLTLYMDRTLLDYMMIEDVSVLNHPTRHIREIIRYSELDGVLDNVVIGSDHSRDYRLYQSGSVYERYWTGSWIGSWTDSTVIGTLHSRLS